MTRSIQLGPHIFTADDSHQTQRSMLENGLNYELHIVQELERLLPAAKCFLDIGANAGIHTLNAARINPNLFQIAVEPTDHNLRLLRQNIADNNLQVVVMDFALSDHTGHVYANSDPDNTQCLSHVDEGHFLRVPCVALDGVEAPPCAPLVKLDVEGAEWQVLRGATKLLSTRPIIIVEFCPLNLQAQGDDPAAFLWWLVEQGYYLTVLAHIPGTRQETCTITDVLKHRTIVEGHITDLLCEPA